MSHQRFFLIFSLAIMLAGTFTANAHEVILVPQTWEAYTTGQKLPFSVVSAHVFMKSEELENPDNVKVSYGGRDIPVTANSAFKTYDGTVTLKKTGAAFLRVHRLGEVWSNTPKGIVKGDRSTLKGVVWSKKYEKFCKTLIPVDGKSDGWDTKTGDLLEIVPFENPLALKAGDTFKVQILYKGKPASPEAVTATYDGFSDSPNAYAYFTEPYGDGEANIKISAPGFWIIRVEYTVDEKGANYDQHVLRSVLAFPVR